MNDLVRRWKEAAARSVEGAGARNGDRGRRRRERRQLERRPPSARPAPTRSPRRHPPMRGIGVFAAPSPPPPLPSFLLLSWGNRKILFLAFPPILSQWLWAGREENTPVCVRRARQNRQTNPKQRESKTKIAPAAHLKTRLKLQR